MIGQSILCSRGPRSPFRRHSFGREGRPAYTVERYCVEDGRLCLGESVGSVSERIYPILFRSDHKVGR